MNRPPKIPAGERLPLDSYIEDFNQHFWNIREEGFWKLERQQTFQEPGVESWEAFARGDWDESLRLLSQQRDHYTRYLNEIAEHGFRLHRVRVVEEPVTPYLQWELHLLHLKAQCGERTRVVGPDSVQALENGSPLPEVIVLGFSVMYEIVYDEQGILRGGVRCADRDVIDAWRGFISELHASGEDLTSYFPRSVAPLGPPSVPAAARIR